MTTSNNRCILNLPDMDEQHRYLYELFDALEPAVHAGTPEAMKNLLVEIERNLLYHFSCEEHLMRMYNFPGFAIHQSDHEQAGNRYVEFMDSFFSGTFNAAAAHSFLSGWLSEHSWISDMQYAEWVKKQRDIVRCSSNTTDAYCSKN